MNKARRKEVQSICDELEELKNRLDCVRDEEQSAYDNMPEGLQNAERGEQMCAYISIMEDMDGSIQDVIDYLMEIVE